MIFFKNLFLLLLLSRVLFSNEVPIDSQEVILTDSSVVLVEDAQNPQIINEFEEPTVMETENINNNIVIEEPIIVENNHIAKESIIESDNNSNVITAKETNSTFEEQLPITTTTTLPLTTKVTSQKTFAEAVAQAKKENKIILLEIYGTNCPYCQKMEDEIFPKKSVIKELKDNFILFRVNGDEEKIPLGITKQMTPMHVFVTPTEDIKDMTFGFLGEKEFLELLDREKN